jgi:hypothetical protein
MPQHRILGIAFAVVALTTGIGTKAATWPVEIDGEQVAMPWYSLSDTPKELAVGDMLYVGNNDGGMWPCVRETKNLSFVSRIKTEAMLYRKIGSELVPVGFNNSDFKPTRQEEAFQEINDEIKTRSITPSFCTLNRR